MKIYRKILRRFFCILLFFLVGCSENLKHPSITIIGGAKSVSGSCYLIETTTSNILVDCGAYYPDSMELSYEDDVELTEELNSKLPLDPDYVSSILITHAHLDHIGKIPLMVKNGYKGKLISTPKSKELSLEMFEMILKGSNLGQEKFLKSKKSYKVHSQESCKWRQKIKHKEWVSLKRSELFDMRLSLCKVCLSIERDKINQLFITHPYGKRFQVADDVYGEFFDAKHIPGSSSILLSINHNGIEKKILFSGDVGSGIDNIMKGSPETPSFADYAFIESTYGAKERNLPSSPYKEFYNDLNTNLKKGGIVWIPSFVLDRTQKVLNIIKKGQLGGRLPENIDIKIVSPTAKKINAIYDKYHDYRPKYVDESFSMSASKLESILYGSKILITPSYVDGIDTFHSIAEKIVADGNSSVLLVGYQDPRSFGGKLKKASKGSKITLSDNDFNVNAYVKYYSGIFSGHYDGNGTLKYLKSIDIKSSIFLVHGNQKAKKELSLLLNRKGYKNIQIPDGINKISIFN